MKPWQEQETLPTSFLGKLFGRKNKSNALVELNNLLASAKSTEDLDEARVVDIETRYRVNLSLEYVEERCRFYSELLEDYLQDKYLAEAELAALSRLKRFLRLSDSNVAAVHDEVTGSVYRESIRTAMNDGQLTEEERLFLKRLESDLRLPEKTAAEISEQVGGDILKKFFGKMVSDQRVSPEEEREFDQLQSTLGIKASYDQKTVQLLDKYRLFWQIENGTIPSIEVDINLRKTEKCYFTCGCQWHELRKQIQRFRYGGPALRIKIVKGVYWRAGDYAVGVKTSENLRLIDQGQIYLTDKRVIFRGSRGNKTISLTRILDFEVYADGILLQKDKGKSPTLILGGDPEVFAMILGRLFQEV